MNVLWLFLSSPIDPIIFLLLKSSSPPFSLISLLPYALISLPPFCFNLLPPFCFAEQSGQMPFLEPLAPEKQRKFLTFVFHFKWLVASFLTFIFHFKWFVTSCLTFVFHFKLFVTSCLTFVFHFTWFVTSCLTEATLRKVNWFVGSRSRTYLFIWLNVLKDFLAKGALKYFFRIKCSQRLLSKWTLNAEKRAFNAEKEVLKYLQCRAHFQPAPQQGHLKQTSYYCIKIFRFDFNMKHHPEYATNQLILHQNIKCRFWSQLKHRPECAYIQA